MIKQTVNSYKSVIQAPLLIICLLSFKHTKLLGTNNKHNKPIQFVKIRPNKII